MHSAANTEEADLIAENEIEVDTTSPVAANEDEADETDEADLIAENEIEVDTTSPVAANEDEADETDEADLSTETADETKEAKVKAERNRKEVRLSADPSLLLSKEGFAMYIGKTPVAITSMAKAGKLPAFYMVDPLKPGGHAELWVHRGEWDEYANQLVEEAPEEWHSWKDRLSHSSPGRQVAKVAAWIKNKSKK